jgi:hypothetical protein
MTAALVAAWGRILRHGALGRFWGDVDNDTAQFHYRDLSYAG